MPRPVVRLLVACGLLLAAAGLGRTTESPVRKPGIATVEDDRARERRQQVRYTASWAVQITKGGDKMADVVARRHGYRNLGKVSSWSALLIHSASSRITILPAARVGNP